MYNYNYVNLIIYDKRERKISTRDPWFQLTH